MALCVRLRVFDVCIDPSSEMSFMWSDWLNMHHTICIVVYYNVRVLGWLPGHYFVRVGVYDMSDLNGISAQK